MHVLPYFFSCDLFSCKHIQLYKLNAFVLLSKDIKHSQMYIFASLHLCMYFLVYIYYTYVFVCIFLYAYLHINVFICTVFYNFIAIFHQLNTRRSFIKNNSGGAIILYTYCFILTFQVL